MQFQNDFHGGGQNLVYRLGSSKKCIRRRGDPRRALSGVFTILSLLDAKYISQEKETMSSAGAVFVPEEVELVTAIERCRATVSLHASGGFGDDRENMIGPRVEERSNLTAPRTPDRCLFQDITDPDRRRAFNETRRFAVAQTLFRPLFSGVDGAWSQSSFSGERRYRSFMR
ncbi:hypothetical protein BSKO_13403 [Bryopsis sp. KO-2023]|nr:hypothetical protein BSKO_13403 [Bryopsis sp. KO-2023]